MFNAMQYQGGALRLIDQRHLPSLETWLELRDLESVALAIENMVVRGAPAIGCAAAYAMALDTNAAAAAEPRRLWGDHAAWFGRGVERLARTRPTAVNLFYALDKMRGLAAALDARMLLGAACLEVERLAATLFEDDLATCMAIGRHGADLAGARRLRILTHCNAGALATAGFGTALGVIRALHERGQVEIVYADETRPWLQGSRLTAFELAAEGIPYRVIADSAAAYLMQQGKVDWAVVGADRIAANGDTANKIGTYSVAVNARHHGVELFVAAPLSTFDPKLASGAMIPVEERSPDEIRWTAGRQMTPSEAPVWNPSFDVTPASLIAGIITEKGVIRPPYAEAIRGLFGASGGLEEAGRRLRF